MMKYRIIFAFSVILAVLGLGILSYSTVITWHNDRVHTATAREFYITATQIPYEEMNEHLLRAYEHNYHLHWISYNMGWRAFGYMAFVPEDYAYILNVDGVLARLEIPLINVDLPVRHGTATETMLKGVGHLEGSSFPIGGYGTHTVMTAHSGMHNVTFFSRLHELEIGDTFYISTMGRRLAYRVDYIVVILPHETEVLRIVPDADFASLITCTPITVNTHRLVVRGARIPD